MKKLSKVFTVLVFVFLFAPIAILIFYSFNEAKSLSVFSGFSLKWYKELINDTDTLNSLRNTLILAVSSSLISTVMGTAAAIAINKLRSRFLKNTIDTVTNIPMTNPDIITGISLMLLFVFTGSLFGLSTSLSFWTMLIAHVTFCLPYVILQVLPKLNQMDRALPEAAMDLGCTPFRAFMQVELPEIFPGILTGLIMAFTLSLDDFVITYFTQGNGFQTLPIRIYNMTKKTVTPKMYALATLIFFVILGLLLLTNLIDSDEDAEKEEGHRKERRVLSEKAKKIVVSCCCAVVAGLICLGIFATEEKVVLNVYNWGEYISDGSEGTLNVVKAFEKWYRQEYGVKLKVNYDTFNSNEDMYNKIVSGAVSYDVIVPSDYMIARMAEEGLLLPLDFGNIPNYEYIRKDFRGLYYDPDNLYTIPYAYGIVGIIYDANKVDAIDTGDWDLMWNPKYSGQILNYNNSRDAFGTAQYKLGINVNSLDKNDWNRALQELSVQKPLLYGRVMDEIYNLMESGEAAIGCYYAGDYFTMVDVQADDVDLQFYYPPRTNYYIDAFCIPSCCQNKELAELFINFMLSEEVAIANAEYTYYACPNSLVFNNEEYIEYMEDAFDIIYPEIDDFVTIYNEYAYRNLSPDMLGYLNELWEKYLIN